MTLTAKRTMLLITGQSVSNKINYYFSYDQGQVKRFTEDGSCLLIMMPEDIRFAEVLVSKSTNENVKKGKRYLPLYPPFIIIPGGLLPWKI